MNCPPQIQISAYADDMLAPAERHRFAAHLQDCALCRQRLEALLALRQSLRELPSPTLGFDLAARLEQQLRINQAGRRRPQRSLWVSWGPPGVAAALSIASGIWLGGVMLGAGTVASPPASLVRVFDPVPPGGLCAAPELCRGSKGMP